MDKFLTIRSHRLSVDEVGTTSQYETVMTRWPDPVAMTNSLVRLHDQFSSHTSSTVKSSTTEGDSGEELWISSIISLTLQLVAFLPCIIGNSLVFVVMAKDKKLRTTTNKLILSLAIADITVGLVVIPIQILLLTPNGINHTNAFCMIHRFMVTFPLGCSLTAVLLLSVDRYIALVHPFMYVERVTSKIVRLSIVGSWMLMFALSWPVMTTLMMPEEERSNNLQKIACITNGIKPEPYGAIYYAVLLAIFVLNICLNILVAKIAMGHYRKVSNTLTPNDRRKAELRNTKLMVAMFGLFNVLWLPYIVMMALFISGTCDNECDKCNMSLQICLSLGVINSATNCYIYAWRKQDFQLAIRQIMERWRRKHNAKSQGVRSIRLSETNRNLSALTNTMTAVASSQQLELHRVTVIENLDFGEQSENRVTWDLSSTTDEESGADNGSTVVSGPGDRTATPNETRVQMDNRSYSGQTMDNQSCSSQTMDNQSSLAQTVDSQSSLGQTVESQSYPSQTITDQV